MKLMRFKVLYFLFSLGLIVPGIYFLAISGLRLGIDFTGGALLEYKLSKPVDTNQLKSDVSSLGVEVSQVTSSSENTYIFRTKQINQPKIDAVKNSLNQKYGPVEERQAQNIGPVIGAELKQKAVSALLLASLMIVLYIAYTFRKVPKPTSSWRFGITAVVALLHDILMVVGMFAVLGKFLGVEVDTLFVTALLTVIGFSVHDTIVVFDRIRENLNKHLGSKFIEVADLSIVQTLGRSLNTSLTVVFVLLALLLFGGETIRWFVAALLIGIVSGTYSSIFNATALLVWWEEKLGH